MKPTELPATIILLNVSEGLTVRKLLKGLLGVEDAEL